MNFIQKNSGVIATVALVIALVGVFTPVGQSVVSKLGGVTNYDEVDATAIKIGGTNGTRIGPIISGTCTGIIANTSITASTTKAFDCAVTGVVSGDYVFWQPASTTPAGNNLGFVVTGASASTTSGYVTLLIANFGPTGAVPYGIASSSNFLILHPVSSVPGL